MNSDIINFSGVYLVALAVGALIFSMCLNFIPWKIRNNYFVWSIPAIAFLVYFILMRFLEDWEKMHEWAQNNVFAPGAFSSYNNSIIVSQAFLLDLCILLSILLPLALIFDPTRRFATILAPFAILGGGITLLSMMFSFSIPDEELSFSLDYIFIGSKNNPLYYIMHVYLICAGTSVMMNSKIKSFYSIIWHHTFIIIYFIYIIVFVYVYGVAWNTTGISQNDWLPEGEYGGVGELINLPYPAVMAVSFSVAYVFVVSCIIINLLLRRRFFRRLNHQKKNKAKDNSKTPNSYSRIQYNRPQVPFNNRFSTPPPQRFNNRQSQRPFVASQPSTSNHAPPYRQTNMNNYGGSYPNKVPPMNHNMRSNRQIKHHN